MDLVADFVRATDALDDVELHSLMVVQHGEVVTQGWWEPYGPEKPHLLYSLSKSFASTALGFAVAEGSVDLDATVLSYFPEFDLRVTDERSRAIRVRDVAAMSSGHEDETIEQAWMAGDGDMLLGLLLVPPQRDPGTVFAYNQPCTYALSAIVHRVGGVPLSEFLRPRLFEPLGIDTWGWRTDQLGREHGFSGLHLRTEAIARLGQLYLNGGEFEGRRLLPAEWVAEATRSHIATGRAEPDWDQGYGFQFWRSRHGYRGDGAFGQFMLVLPELDAVVAITGQSMNMQGVLDAAWEHLLPALGAKATAASPPGGGLPRPAATGTPGRLEPGVYRPGPGNDLSHLVKVEVDGGRVTLTDRGGPVVVTPADADRWTETGPAATAQAWRDGRLALDVVFTETPHRLHLLLDPAEQRFEAHWMTTPLDDPPLMGMRMPR